MNSKQFDDKPIQLVSINSFGKLVLHAEGVAFLRTLTPPIAIATITGPVKTGKSYLMNQIISKTQAFQIGQGEQKTTKGMWMWSKPVLAYNQQGKIASVILIDSQGFSADQDEDIRILSLSLLFSSCIMYNSISPIDKNSLIEMSPFINIAHTLQTQQKTSQCDFHWMVRDFDQQLINEFDIEISSKQYMQNCFLQITDKRLLDTIQVIKTYFSSRNCHCLIKPSHQHEQQHPQFMQQIIELRKILNGIKSYSMDGPSLIIVLEAYIDALNNEDSLQKVYQQGNDCKLRLNCLQKLNDQLRSLQQKQSLNQIQDIDQKLYDIRINLKQYYKQRMCSDKQIKVLDQELNQILQDFQDINQNKPYNSIKLMEQQRSREIIRLKVPKQQKMMRVSINVNEADKFQNQVRPSVSRFTTSKTLQSKLQQFETKVYRYELQASCSKKQMQILKDQYEKSKKQVDQVQDQMETIITNFSRKQKILESRIYQQQQLIAQLKKQKLIAESQIQKIKILNNQKIQYLEKQLLEVTQNINKERNEKEERYKVKLNEYFREVEELKQSHQEEILQLKNIYKSNNQKLNESSHGKFTETYYKDMKEQQQLIQKLKQQNQKNRFAKAEVENNLKIMKNRLQNRQDYYKDYTQQVNKRSKETEKYIQSLYQTKLQSKDHIIQELQNKISQLSQNKQQEEVSNDKIIQSKNAEMADLEADFNKKTIKVQQMTLELNRLRKEVQQYQEQTKKLKQKFRKFIQNEDQLKKQIFQLNQSNTQLKNIFTKTQRQYEQITLSNQSLINEFKNQLENQKQQKQFISQRSEEQYKQIKNIFEVDKERLQLRIDELNEAIDHYRKIQLQYDDLQHQSTQTEFMLRQTLEQKDKELHFIKMEYQNSVKYVTELKEKNTKTQENLILQLEESRIHFEETVNELETQKQQLQQKYNILLQTINNKEQEIYLQNQKYQKQIRSWKFKEEDFKNTVSKLSDKATQEQQNKFKEDDKYKNQLVAFKKENLQLSNKVALLTQKNIFLQQNMNIKIQSKKSEISKIIQKANKNEEKYTENIKIKEQQLQTLRKQLQLHLKQKQILVQNLNQIQNKHRSQQRRYQSHLNLFSSKLQEVKQQNCELRKTLDQYRNDYQQLKSIKQNIDYNYQKDSQLWRNKLAICEQKILSMRRTQ